MITGDDIKKLIDQFGYEYAQKYYQQAFECDYGALIRKYVRNCCALTAKLVENLNEMALECSCADVFYYIEDFAKENQDLERNLFILSAQPDVKEDDYDFYRITLMLQGVSTNEYEISEEGNKEKIKELGEYLSKTLKEYVSFDYQNDSFILNDGFETAYPDGAFKKNPDIFCFLNKTITPESRCEPIQTFISNTAKPNTRYYICLSGTQKKNKLVFYQKEVI